MATPADTACRMTLPWGRAGADDVSRHLQFGGLDVVRYAQVAAYLATSLETEVGLTELSNAETAATAPQLHPQFPGRMDDVVVVMMVVMGLLSNLVAVDGNSGAFHLPLRNRTE
jgi:hypothetical protein